MRPNRPHESKQRSVIPTSFIKEAGEASTSVRTAGPKDLTVTDMKGSGEFLSNLMDTRRNSQNNDPTLDDKGFD